MDAEHWCPPSKIRELRDARGVFCCYACDECEARKRLKFRAEIFTDAGYQADERIDDDDEHPTRCTDPNGHAWVTSEETDRCYCEHCNQDGDA